MFDMRCFGSLCRQRPAIEALVTGVRIATGPGREVDTLPADPSDISHSPAASPDLRASLRPIGERNARLRRRKHAEDAEIHGNVFLNIPVD